MESARASDIAWMETVVMVEEEYPYSFNDYDIQMDSSVCANPSTSSLPARKTSDKKLDNL